MRTERHKNDTVPFLSVEHGGKIAIQISKKRKFVTDAQMNEFLTQELAEDGYSGVEMRVTPTRTEIIILATRTQNVLGEKGRRIRELTAVVQKRFGFPEGSVELYAEKVATRGLCAIAQAESLRYKLLGGNRRVGSQSRLPCPSQSPQHNRVSLAAVFWSQGRQII
uniref:KH type-2 domain-containing protein n=1 Tax=Gorilla gorilla gorilla TaxID=9595 RepID=A0A2I2ZGZ5_GORGO